MKSTKVVAEEIACMLAESSDEHDRISFFDYGDYMRHIEEIEAILNGVLEQEGGICS